MGAGSGLDADSIDGKHWTDILDLAKIPLMEIEPRDAATGFIQSGMYLSNFKKTTSMLNDWFVNVEDEYFKVELKRAGWYSIRGRFTVRHINNVSIANKKFGFTVELNTDGEISNKVIGAKLSSVTTTAVYHVYEGETLVYSNGSSHFLMRFSTDVGNVVFSSQQNFINDFCTTKIIVAYLAKSIDE